MLYIFPSKNLFKTLVQIRRGIGVNYPYIKQAHTCTLWLPYIIYQCQLDESQRMSYMYMYMYHMV